MKRIVGIAIGLVLMAMTGGQAADAPPVKVMGTGPAYDALGKLAVMHAGRAKPLDTLAREEVKQIFGRETIKLLNDKNEVVETWGPTAAILDWSVRPSFWDDQPIILTQYLPLKRMILADALNAQINALLADSKISEADKTGLKALQADKALTGKSIETFLKKSFIPKADRTGLETVGAELSEEHKWLSPRELEEANVVVDGAPPIPFISWVMALRQKSSEVDVKGVALTDLEENAYETGIRLVHFRAIRDRQPAPPIPLYVVPRPHNATYLGYIATLLDKYQKQELSTPTPIINDTLNVLQTYWEDVPNENRAIPGTNAKADAGLTAWLKNRSVWIPLKVILDTSPEDLAAAGFDSGKAAAFQKAFADLEKSEEESPGKLDESKASAFVAAARSLGVSLNEMSYPTTGDVGRETYFNRTNPFWNAPIAYGLATVLLAMTLGFQGFAVGTMGAKIGRGLYYAGVAGLIGGLGLEVVGFTLRVMISGWAPVTNMYETVIWVSFFAGALGLVFEVIYRKTFTALAAAGLAFPGTLLAANVPLLDPNIHALQPVLRSNYWLTIHVLTEVSSYGAFLLAAALGFIAVIYYLTATYRRSPSYTQLASPLLLGVPFLGIGLVGLQNAQGGPTGLPYALAVLFAGVGGMTTLISLLCLLGEMASRLTFAGDTPIDPDFAPEPQPARPSGAPKPTVAEIRAMAAASRPKLDARGQSMQATAANIKPIANFVYRTMQVGVLLIAAGTFLGGWWADKSWGRFWGWDPKEVWALITLLVYLVPLHGRFAGWCNTFYLCAASIVCSMSVVMAWYGVNFVLGAGLHTYGFMKGGGQGIVSAVCLAFIAFPVAAWWRRYLGSQPLTLPVKVD